MARTRDRHAAVHGLLAAGHSQRDAVKGIISLSSMAGSYQRYGAPGSRYRTRLNQERSTSATLRTRPCRDSPEVATGRALRA